MVESRTPRIVNRPTTRHRFPAGRADTICDPRLIGNDDATLLAMGEVFYPDLDAQELRRKFDGFVEYPTDLTTMAKMALDAGFRSKIHVINRMVAVLDATPATSAR